MNGLIANPNEGPSGTFIANIFKNQHRELAKEIFLIPSNGGESKCPLTAS